MRQPIFTRNTLPPLESAAADMLSAVDYIIRQHALRGGEIAPDQMTALLASATTLRRELRGAERERAAP